MLMSDYVIFRNLIPEPGLQTEIVRFVISVICVNPIMPPRLACLWVDQSLLQALNKGKQITKKKKKKESESEVLSDSSQPHGL